MIIRVFGKDLNSDEILTGVAHGAFTAFFIGWWSVLAMLLCGFLWAWGGAAGTSKSWRRWGVPLVVCVSIALVKWIWYPLVSIPFYFGILTIGYGIPSAHPLPDGDEGSWLGRLVTKWVTGSYNPPPLDKEHIIDVYVRGLLAVLCVLMLVSTALISWVAWLAGGLVLIILTLIAAG